MDFYVSGPAGASFRYGTVLPGMGPRSGVRARPGPWAGFSLAVKGKRGLRGRVVGIVPCEDGSKVTKIFLVAIKGQDVAGVVWRFFVVWMALARSSRTGWAKEWGHPVAVLISIEEGEVKGLSPAGGQPKGLALGRGNMVRHNHNWPTLWWEINRRQ